MEVLSNLEPKKVWQYFEQITKIPRPSKKEEKMVEFLMNFAKENNIEAKRDKVGNVVMRKPATKGMENRKSVVLQAHMDMVCEKNSDVNIDFEKDGITPYVDGEWVKAKGTTLGADDGIGVAAGMAILTDDSIEHGPIECLFTIDEETGLTGAEAVEAGFFESEILLNMDDEDEGEMCIGCAGGIDTVADFSYQKESVPEHHVAYKFIINGLAGGHSGDEIHKGLGNSNKIANRFLQKVTSKYFARLADFNGGNKRNAIPREAEVVFTVKADFANDVKKEFVKYKADILKEIKITEPNINLELHDTAMPAFVIDEETQRNLIMALSACPHGVHAWSAAIKGLVETSTNLASVKFIDDKIQVTTSQRSSLESGKEEINTMVRNVFFLAGAHVESGDGYPGWAPNPDSEILRIVVASYKRLFNKEPRVRAIHAGLECGLFLEKYPNLDMVSFGPTLRGVHSPDEKIEIKTVEMWFSHLTDVLKNIPVK